MLYSIRNLKKIYNGRTVLDIPELSIKSGKIYGLLGPNGSGKTTLLSILGLLNAPTSGTLFYQDKPVVFSEKKMQPLRREIILVDQHPIMFTTSVFKNVAFGLKLRKIHGKEQRQRVEEALDRVGMTDFIHAAAYSLSGGETQRVAIARALACSPKVMLFDEPTASVDVNNQMAIEQIISDLQAEGKMSIILTTHNLFQASRLAQEKIYLFEGRAGASVYENLFNGKALTTEKGGGCLIRETVWIPLKDSATGPVKISINPKSIQVYPVPPKEASNLIKGCINQLNLEKEWVRLKVEVGIPLSVLVKTTSFYKMNLGIGDVVYVKIPEYGVSLI